MGTDGPGVAGVPPGGVDACGPAAGPEPDHAEVVALVVGDDIPGAGAGQYFVRLQIDGAESPVDLDPASVTFGPTVTLP